KDPLSFGVVSSEDPGVFPGGGPLANRARPVRRFCPWCAHRVDADGAGGCALPRRTEEHERESALATGGGSQAVAASHTRRGVRGADGDGPGTGALRSPGGPHRRDRAVREPAPSWPATITHMSDLAAASHSERRPTS